MKQHKNKRVRVSDKHTLAADSLDSNFQDADFFVVFYMIYIFFDLYYYPPEISTLVGEKAERDCAQYKRVIPACPAFLPPPPPLLLPLLPDPQRRKCSASLLCYAVLYFKLYKRFYNEKTTSALIP
jgi:hypothetical protein